MAGKLSMLRGRAKRVAAAAFASALTLFALTGTATPAVAETATPEITPEAKKWVDSNDDGTYTLNLSVTGKQESSSETVNQKADVILVMDVSTSMGKAETGNFGPEGDRLTYAKKAANQLVDELFSDETSSNVRVAVVPFGTIAKKTEFTSNKADASAAINSLKIQTSGLGGFGDWVGGGTNWEAGLGNASEMMAQSGRNDAKKYIIFLSDGEPQESCTHKDKNGRTLSYNSGEEKWGYKTGNNWTWVDESEHVVDYSGYTYAFSGESYVGAVDAAKKAGSDVGFFSVSLGKGSYHTTMQNLQMAVTGKTTADGCYSGENPDGLLDAFKDISQTIHKTVSFKNVDVTDYLNSDYFTLVDEDGNPVENIADAAYTCTKDNQPFNATVEMGENGQIKWDLGEGTLEQGAVYKLSFKIAPTQAAYDKAANEATKAKPYAVLKTNGDDINGKGEATVHFTRVKTQTGTGDVEKEETKGLKSPELQIAPTTLHIKKTWADSGTHPEVTISVADKNETLNLKTVNLAETNKWTDTVYIAAGPQGHKYTVTEIGANGYKATYTLSEKDVQGEQAVENSQFEVSGLVSKELTLTVTNTRSTGSLSITKYVSGSAANTTEHFTFELSATGDSLKQLTGSYDATYVMAGGSAVDKNETGHPAKIQFDANGKATVQLRHNETVTIADLPSDVTITVTEDTTGKAYSTPYYKLNEAKDYTEGSQVDANILTSPAVTKVFFKNTADAAPDNGVSSDSTPMVGLFAAAAIGGTALYAANRGKRGQDAWKE